MNIAILSDEDMEHLETIMYSSVKQLFNATETCYFKGPRLDSTIKLNIVPAGRILWI